MPADDCTRIIPCRCVHTRVVAIVSTPLVIGLRAGVVPNAVAQPYKNRRVVEVLKESSRKDTSSMRRFASIGSLITVLIATPPPPAAADWVLTPYVGGALFDITDTGARPVLGGSVAWMGPVAGFEVDLGDAPKFLESRPSQAIDTANLFILMGNGVVQFPTAWRRIRPYVAGGIGVIHTKITAPGGVVLVEDENFGFNVGGGLMALLNDRVGVRGDFRYLRALRNDDATSAADALEVSELKFLRVTVGVAFNF